MNDKTKPSFDPRGSTLEGLAEQLDAAGGPVCTEAAHRLRNFATFLANASGEGEYVFLSGEPVSVNPHVSTFLRGAGFVRLPEHVETRIQTGSWAVKPGTPRERAVLALWDAVIALAEDSLATCVAWPETIQALHVALGRVAREAGGG